MRLIAFLCGFGLISSVAATASAAPDGRFGIGGDLVLVAPVGDMADGTGVLLGPVVRFGYRVLPALELTGRTGYLVGFNRSQGSFSTSLSDLPIWAGARYFILDPDAGPFVAGELGLNFLHEGLSGAPSVTLPGGAGAVEVAFPTRNLARLGFDIGAGWVLSKDLPIELRAQLNCFNLLGQSSGESTLLGIGLSAGYTYRF